MAQVIEFPPPSEKQTLFLKDTHRHVAYGGARGGGKSWAIRTKAVLLALQYPKIKILIIRKTYKELFNNHIMPLQEIIPKEIATYNGSDKVFKFKNGSTISLGYCNNDGDVLQYQGAEYDVVFLDEATHLKEEWIRKINTSVRGVNGFPKRTYYTCNPNGQGLHYIKRLFIDKKYIGSENPDDYSFIQALVTDNKVLMEMQPEYYDELLTLPPKIRDAWLYGKWDVFEGQFFEEFTDNPEHYKDRQWTHVIEPFEIPDDWTIYRGFDWGYNKPFSCSWWAIDHDGVMYRICGLYGCTQTANEGVKWTPQQVFAEIHRIECEHQWLVNKHIVGIADPAIWDAEYGESIAEVAAKNQVYFQKGDNKRIAGWMQLHYRLMFDENGYPMMYIFNVESNKPFIRTIPLLMYDEHKVEDLDTDGEDHIADETRYVCMARPIKPKTVLPPDDWEENPAHVFLDVAKEDLGKANKHRQKMQIKA